MTMRTIVCALALGLALPVAVWAQTSPAVPTTQEVPPPVPSVQPRSGTELPSTTDAPAPAATTSGPAPEEAPPTASSPTPGATAPREASPRAAAAPTSPKAVRAAPLERPGARRHDGFFARLSAGFGPWRESLSAEDAETYGGRVEGRSTGISMASDLTIGGTPTKRLVVALSLQQTELLASTFRLSDRSEAAPPAELDPGLRQLFSVGPTFIFYPNDRGGFFFEGGLAFAALVPADASAENRGDNEIYVAGGIALPLSLGMQWFFADQVSVGVRGRFTGAILGGEDQRGVEWLHVVGASPAVMFDLVYH